MFLLGYDLGSSSVKVSIIDSGTGRCVASDYQPRTEMPITAKRKGWAEQNPEMWWENLKKATHSVMGQSGVRGEDIAAIGISYQMHGLVVIDGGGRVLRDSIIWCDSRAVETGEKAFERLGEDYCLNHLLNRPGNFTASKLAWVRENEPEVFGKIDKIMLPGDYMAFRMTGDVRTTVPGLSEGMFWDFEEEAVSRELLEVMGIPSGMLSDVVPTFGHQGELTRAAAEELGLNAGTPVTYRAGDQPNNAFSLNVLNPGEIAATAGTSGAVYGVMEQNAGDRLSRVNTVVHVNHTERRRRLGMLLCINGAGSLMSWMKRNVGDSSAGYREIDEACAAIRIGSEGVSAVPFGNGSERIFCNADLGGSFHGLNFNIHNRWHMLRAAQEGVAFAFKYGMDIMSGLGMDTRIIRAGDANMFKSPVFRESLANAAGTVIELYDTDGSVGAARGAGVGVGLYASPEEAFTTLERISSTEPDPAKQEAYGEAYQRWLEFLTIN